MAKFQKGQSGNPGGRPKSGTGLTDQLRHKTTPTRRAELIEALYRAAVGYWYEDFDKKGNERIYRTGPDIKALTLYFDRHDGKLPQPLSGDPEHPLIVGVVKIGEEEIPRAGGPAIE